MRKPIEATPWGSFRVMLCDEEEVRFLESDFKTLEEETHVEHQRQLVFIEDQAKKIDILRQDIICMCNDIKCGLAELTDNENTEMDLKHFLSTWDLK